MIKKQYLKTKAICKVTFTLPLDAVSANTEVRVVGDFNEWNWETGVPMKANKKEYKAIVELPTGKNYEFRYLMANGSWENDWNADAYVPSPFYGIDNSVVSVDVAKGKGEAAPKKDKAPAKATSTVATKKKATPKKVAPKKTKADNLKVIEGIGPKIEKILKDKGIKSFADLAKAKQTFLKEVLVEAGSRFKMHDPTTWPEQASLAAKGETEKLAALQAELKGGKR